MEFLHSVNNYHISVKYVIHMLYSSDTHCTVSDSSVESIPIPQSLTFEWYFSIICILL